MITRAAVQLEKTQRWRPVGLQVGEIDREVVLRWFTSRGLKPESVAAHDARYRRKEFSFAYRKNVATGLLSVRLNLDDYESVDEGLLRYLTAKLNNAVLILGGKSASASGPESAVHVLEQRLSTDERIVECYGSEFSWKFLPDRAAKDVTLAQEVSRRTSAKPTAEPQMRVPMGLWVADRDNSLLIGMDVGASGTKFVVVKRGEAVDAHINRFLLSQQHSLSGIENALAESRWERGA